MRIIKIFLILQTHYLLRQKHSNFFMKYFKKYFLVLAAFLALLFILPSCHSRMKVCTSNSMESSKKFRKNKSNYSKRYSSKSKSVRKDYVIKNKRKRKY